jgi:post-segregation antitoxin (ccd killing protein)
MKKTKDKNADLKRKSDLKIISVKIEQAQYDYLKKYDINISKLLRRAIDELMN